jgi:hypothetical protein
MNRYRPKGYYQIHIQPVPVQGISVVAKLYPSTLIERKYAIEISLPLSVRGLEKET